MTETVRIPIDGMTCNACVARITRTLRRLDGVEAVRVDLGSDSATVRYDTGRTSLAAIGEEIGRAGYEARIAGATPFEPGPHRSLLARLRLRRD